MGRRIYESYIEGRRRGREWGRISEAPYFMQRERVLGR